MANLQPPPDIKSARFPGWLRDIWYKVVGTSDYVDQFGNQTPLSGTKVYYVADSSGGAVTRKLTFINGILVSET